MDFYVNVTNKSETYLTFEYNNYGKSQGSNATLNFTSPGNVVVVYEILGETNL